MAEALLIDQRSAFVAMSPDEIKSWWRGRGVFVSSLIAAMPAERAAARAAIADVGGRPVMFEHDLGAQDVAAQQAYLSGVRGSEVYLGLWGSAYGVRLADGDSATHAEFREAENGGLRLALFVHDERWSDFDRDQRQLVASAREVYTTSPWSAPDDLRERIARRLTDLASEELAPWVRIGRCIFRATSIRSEGEKVSVTATIRTGPVVAELTRMRDSRANDVPFATPHLAGVVAIQSLSTEMRSTTTQDVVVELRFRALSTGYSRMSVQGKSAEEIARRALEDGLFGTSTLGDSSWFAKPIDPLAPLRGQQLDDAVARPVSRLLLTEHLLTSGEASTVDVFALGPAQQGRRHLRLRWSPSRRYTNEADPAPVQIDGIVDGV